MSLDDYLVIGPNMEFEVCDDCKAMRLMGVMMTGRCEGYTPCRIEHYFSQYLTKTPRRKRSNNDGLGAQSKSEGQSKPSKTKGLSTKVESKKEQSKEQHKSENSTQKNCNIATLNPIMEMPGLKETLEPGQAALHMVMMTNHLTGEIYQIDLNEVKEKYQGREVEFVLKIQVPFPMPWHFLGTTDTEHIMIYNKQRDFVAYISKKDPGFAKLEEMILSQGVDCVNPGKKGHFFTKLRNDMKLDIYLDRITHESW